MARARYVRSKPSPPKGATRGVGEERAELVRFVGDQPDSASGQPEGIFQLAFRVDRDAKLTTGDRVSLKENLDWLTAHLETPRRLSPFRNALPRGRRRVSRREAIAVSWFKPSAVEHIARARAIAQVLRHAGFPVEEVRTIRPGYITHEDDLQIVAVPFGGSHSG